MRSPSPNRKSKIERRGAPKGNRKSSTPHVAVILPGAGRGSRFGAPENKIFQVVAGREVFLWTAQCFARRADVCQILLTVSASDAGIIRERYAEALAAMNVVCVEGGATRSRSVRNALAALDARAELVCVHDAVRPCVSDEQVDAVFDMAGRTGAAILALPVSATIKQVGPEGRILRTVPREDLWSAQTPQVFRRDWLQDAYAAGADATDDAELVQALGHGVHVVPGDPRNVKITTPGDLALAAVFLAGEAAR